MLTQSITGISFHSGLICEICMLSIPFRMGKQGYECRDCLLKCHKQCHVRTPQLCPKPTIQSIELWVVFEVFWNHLKWLKLSLGGAFGGGAFLKWTVFNVFNFIWATKALNIKNFKTLSNKSFSYKNQAKKLLFLKSEQQKLFSKFSSLISPQFLKTEQHKLFFLALN